VLLLRLLLKLLLCQDISLMLLLLLLLMPVCCVCTFLRKLHCAPALPVATDQRNNMHDLCSASIPSPPFLPSTNMYFPAQV
jgi:hypothetical protein